MDTKRDLLFLTNLYNDSPEEDIFLTEQLRKAFNVCISHPLDIEGIEDNFDIALIRNIWPSHEYEDQKTELIRRLTNKGLMPTSSTERGYFEQDHYLEKDYLVDLYTKGYPVIPSIDDLSSIERLGLCEEYFFKPKNQCDGGGSMRLSKDKTHSVDLTDALLQPFIQFDYEVCFYFVDNEFVYAFSVPNRLKEGGYEVYVPTEEDMQFAQKFVRWNNLSFGLQRVDAVRVSDTKELLLTELEDFCPYLYLLELPEYVRDKAVEVITNSLKKRSESM